MQIKKKWEKDIDWNEMRWENNVQNDLMILSTKTKNNEEIVIIYKKNYNVATASLNHSWESTLSIFNRSSGFFINNYTLSSIYTNIIHLL